MPVFTKNDRSVVVRQYLGDWVVYCKEDDVWRLGIVSCKRRKDATVVKNEKLQGQKHYDLARLDSEGQRIYNPERFRFIGNPPVAQKKS